ncbi:hypothetical protein [Nocardia huaxiensis]|uniref:Uncharacterized protein n=1 Tax=Nocardia huaxiensis TaxID=2755382 RepID=A0A7D6V864_9NOCA|nr:hypothetical protein [Nocardia huaxiensis]QLY28002.1 hypothetical protein H0264_21570 [Nocardia huaxiensis]UFS98592.1 hypothetical protein LPY97_12185 [Nocardia huaxiensis]
MRPSIGLLMAAATAAALTGTAASVSAPASASPAIAPVADSETGSSAADSASAAAQSAVYLAGRGDVIGVIVLLGITPIHMITGGICDLVTWSGSSDPCSPTRYPAVSHAP